MQNGDLALWSDSRVCVVLEGVLATVPSPAHVTHRKWLRREKRVEIPESNDWVWATYAIKVLNDKATRHNIPIDVATFISPEVADQAAEWFLKYDVRVSSVDFYEFDRFCQSILWSPSTHTVVDSDPERLQHYGIKGYQTQWGGDF